MLHDGDHQGSLLPNADERNNGTAMSKILGPASYFPSIEAKYGRSIGLATWKELMAWLKTEHGMGHGHANALTIDFLDDLRRESRP
jgi:hypothetical protein